MQATMSPHTGTILVLGTDRLLAVFDMAAAFCQETGQPHKIIPSVAAETWAGMMDQGIATVFGLDQSGRLLGALGAFLYHDPYDGALIAQEGFWYVRPEARRGSGGLALFEAFEAWGRAHQAQRFIASYLLDVHPALARFYRRRGYGSPQQLFLKESTACG